MKRYLFYLNLTALMLGIAGVFGATGLLAYRALSEIANSIRDQGKPDLKLATIKEIASELDRTENNIKLYRLTSDKHYLVPYHTMLNNTDQKMSSLYEMYKDQQDQTLQLDSIEGFLQEKYLIWSKLIGMKEKSGVAKALGQLSEKFIPPPDTDTVANIASVEPVTPKPDTVVQEKPKEENLSFWKRLFSHKKEEKPAEEKQAEPPKEEPQMAEVKEEGHINPLELKAEINRLELEDSLLKKQQINRELFLLKKNNSVSVQIGALISRMEKAEMAEIAKHAKEADAMANRTRQWILLFSVAISVLLFTVFIVIISYTRKWVAYQRALQKAKVEAENLARIKEQFLANMSHELRTPMNAIVGFAEQLSQEKLAAKSQEKVSIIGKSARHLVKLITEILDFTKIEAGRMVLEEGPFSLEEIFYEIEQLMLHEATRKNIKITTNVDTSVPAILRGDAFRLKQILLNLVSNALKFTDEGSVDLFASAENTEKEQYLVAIQVRDTGIGITPEKLNSIFDDFIQAESSTSRKYGGTGLGLAIVKKLTELQKGSVKVESEPDKGSCFTICIPYVSVPNDVLPSKEEKFAPDTTPLKDLNILIADDTEFNRLIIAETLKKWEVSFDEATNGFEAVEKATGEKYDLILMDMRMPGMDGLTAALRIREAFDENDRPPIVAITAGISQTEREQCLDAGISEFMLKPFTEEKLYETLLRNRKGINGIEYKSEAKRPLLARKNNSTSSPDKINFDQLNRLGNNNETFVREMLEIFLKTAREGVQEIMKKVEEKQWEEAAEAAHKMASPCRVLEITHMLECLKNIEDSGRSKKDTDKLTVWITELRSELKIVTKQIEEYLKVKV